MRAAVCNIDVKKFDHLEVDNEVELVELLLVEREPETSSE